MRSAPSFGFQGSLPEADARRILKAVYHPDQPVEIGVPEDDRIHWYRSRFLRLGRHATEDPLSALAPFTPEGTPALHLGQQVLVYFLLERRGYAFETIVLDRSAEQLSEGVTVPSVVLAPPKTLYNSQRREYVRVKPYRATEAIVRWQPPEEAEGHKVVSEVRGYIDDLSQGGGRVRVPEFTIAENEAVRVISDVNVEFALELEARHVPMKLAAGVARVSSETEPRRLLWIALRWQDPTDQERKALADFILISEREMLRRRRESEA